MTMDETFANLAQFDLLKKGDERYLEPPQYGGRCRNCGKWNISDVEDGKIDCGCGESVTTDFRLRDYSERKKDVK